MLAYIAAYLASALTLGALDAVWLGLLARKTYQTEIGGLLLEKPNWLAAILFYALYIGAVQVLAVVPAVQAGSWSRAVIAGAALGLAAYAAYDLTNMATMKGFSWKIVAIDLPWGVLVTGLAALAGYFAMRAAS